MSFSGKAEHEPITYSTNAKHIFKPVTLGFIFLLEFLFCSIYFLMCIHNNYLFAFVVVVLFIYVAFIFIFFTYLL